MYHYQRKSLISDKIFRRATDGTRMEHGFPKETFQGKLSSPCSPLFPKPSEIYLFPCLIRVPSVAQDLPRHRLHSRFDRSCLDPLPWLRLCRSGTTVVASDGPFSGNDYV